MLENEGLDQDDGDHMESFFRNRDVGAEPEMNRRKIMPEIEMTGEAYQAKRVTREEIENQNSESDESGSQDEEMGEEEIEESDDSALSEPIQPKDKETDENMKLLK